MRRILVLLAALAFGLVPGLSATAQNASQSTIVTVAGNGVDGHDGDVGPATGAAINHPRGIAVRPGGDFVFASPFVPAIRSVIRDGLGAYRIFTVAGTRVTGFSGDGGPATSAQLNLPHGVAFLPDGSLVIADTGNHRIRHISPTGTISTIAGTGTFGFSGDGGPATAAQIAAPRGIATLPDGSILFPDTGNHRIRRISPEGTITTVAGTGTVGAGGDGGPATAAQLNLPFAVSPTKDGGFLIADAGNSRVRRVDRNGVISTVATELGAPHAVAALPDSGFLVADTNNHRVVRVSATGAIAAVFGTGIPGFSGDSGPATLATFNLPKALAVLPDLSGFLVGDSQNNRVRLVRIDLRPPLELRILTKPVRTTAGRAATLRYALSEDATAQLQVLRRGVAVLGVRQRGRAGVNVMTFGRTLKPGAYSLRLRAEAAGGRTDSATATLSVRKRP